jgi:hypothetical protein
MHLDDDQKDWWNVSTMKRNVFIRNESRSGAITDFLMRFPDEDQSGVDAELARGFLFFDDEADRLRKEVKELRDKDYDEDKGPLGKLLETLNAKPSGCCGGGGGCGTDGGCCGGTKCGDHAGKHPVVITGVRDDEEDEYGNLTPQDCYFCVNTNAEFGGDDDGSIVLMVCPKDYWDREHAAYDGGLGEIDKYFPEYLQNPEDMECSWYVPEGYSMEQVAIDMTAAGFTRNFELEGVVENTQEG